MTKNSYPQYTNSFPHWEKKRLKQKMTPPKKKLTEIVKKKIHKQQVNAREFTQNH